MKNRLRLNEFILAVSLAVLLASPAETRAQKPGKPGDGGGTSVSYAIVRLAEADGLVTAINNQGQAVGWIESAAGHQAILWAAGSGGDYVGMPLSSTIGSEAITLRSLPQDINDDGLVTGVVADSQTGLGGWLPVIWLNAAAQPNVLPYGPLVFPGAIVEGGASGICNTPEAQLGLRAVVVGRYIEYPEGVLGAEKVPARRTKPCLVRICVRPRTFDRSMASTCP